jgi:5'-nucleotidase
VSINRTREYDFSHAARAAAEVAAAVLARGLSAKTFLSLNVPLGTPRGLRVTTQARRNHITKINARTDPRGQAYYWIEEALDEWHPDGGRSDYEAVSEGYVSVTPLQADMTDHKALAEVEALIQPK